jgi:hypothetical protein
VTWNSRTSAPVAAELQSEINIPKFEEPPPLDEWLKGRTILTVSQDGRGQFRTIADAVKALKPGQVVEILDQGPYRENLWIENPPAESGIISRVNTLLAPIQWRASERTWMAAHRISNVDIFRVSGLVLVGPNNTIPDWCHGDTVFLWIPNGVSVMESCTVVERHAVVRPQRSESLSVSLQSADLTMRSNVVKGSLVVFSRSASDACCRIIENWIHHDASRLSAQIGITSAGGGRFAFRCNVITGSGGVYYDSRPTSKPRVSFAGNTILARGSSLLAYGVSDGEVVHWQANLLVGRLVGRDSVPVLKDWKPIREWNIVDNLIWLGTLDDADEARVLGIRTVVEEPKWLSLDPHDHRNYMRVSNPSVILNRDGKQEYIGALPPGPAPPEGDWFTRLLERWEEVQQRIEKLQAEDAAGSRESAPVPAKDAPAEKPLTRENVQ